MIDNKRIADETAKLQIRDFYLASSPPSESFMVKYQGHVTHSSPVKSHPERMPEMQNVTPRYGTHVKTENISPFTFFDEFAKVYTIHLKVS